MMSLAAHLGRMDLATGGLVRLLDRQEGLASSILGSARSTPSLCAISVVEHRLLPVTAGGSNGARPL